MKNLHSIRPYAAAATLALSGITFSSATVAGTYIFAGETYGADLITHPSNYNGSGSGGTLTVRVCIVQNTPNTTDMEIPVQNSINVFNALQATTGNLLLGGANNIPGSSMIDFESVTLHEIGHCLGLGHVNLASESGQSGNNRNYTKSTDGGDNLFNVNPGPDGTIGSGDDVRGDDVNLHWFRKSNNNPFTIATIVDGSTYSRDLADLPSGHDYAANGDRDVADLLGIANTEAVMQQGTFFDEAQRTLTHDDVATLLLAASGADETAGTSDDYTIRLEYGGITTSNCDINISFDSAVTQNSLAFCETGGRSIPPTDHFRITSADIYLNETFNWFFNTDTVNQPPVLSAIGDQHILAGQSLPVAISAADPEGDNLAFSATGLPPFATLTDHGNGTATLDINPGINEATNSYGVTITVYDDGLPALHHDETFDISVTSPDTDGDGLDYVTELSIGTNPNLPDTDGDQLSDGIEFSLGSDPLDPGSWPAIADGDLAPLGNPDGNVNAADVLIAVRIVLGAVTPSALQLAHGDLYPPGAPDDVIDLSDVLLLQKWVLGLP